jgi:transposase-like protein
MVQTVEGTPIRPGGEYFLSPANAQQRRYEALRAYLLEGASREDAAARFGYTPQTLASLVRDFRAGHLEFFGPRALARRRSPAKERARARIVELRQAGHSAIEISAALKAEGMALNRTGVAEVLAEEGFERLATRPYRERVLPRRGELPRTGTIDFAALPGVCDTRVAGLFLAVPDLVALDLPDIVKAAGYPGTRTVPALSSILSLLALKLIGMRRVSHVDDIAADPGAALFAGLSALPKKSALTDYSYRLDHDRQRSFLTALDRSMIGSGLATADQAVFDLDFHAIMHWGQDPALEKHYVPARSQRTRSVLTFFAQDSGTHNLVYANADISKAAQNREVIAFADHWLDTTGADPHMLVMDQKVTTQPVLAELDGRGIKFLTLRMRSPALIAQIEALPKDAFKAVTLDRAGVHRRPKVAEQTGVKLSNYPGTLRQLVVTGLGREAPTVIITNDHDIPVKALIGHYARRMTIEQRLAESIRAFGLDALAGAVNLNIDLDVVLTVLAGALCAALRRRLPGYTGATPDTLQRRFLETSGQIINRGDHIIVQLNRRTYSPVLRHADIPAVTTVPWWGNRQLHFKYT